MTFRNRLDTDSWRLLREQVLLRDEFTCRLKGNAVAGECEGTLDVHHVYPHRIVKEDNPVFLVSVCKKHHKYLDNKYLRMGGLTNYERALIEWNKEHSV